jgi:hypothetical protein
MKETPRRNELDGKGTVVAQPTNAGRVRMAALERIERAEQRYKLGLVVMVAVDAVFAVLFFLLMDFHDRLHWLLVIGLCGICGVIVVCVINLSIYVDSAMQTVLKAILARDQNDNKTPLTAQSQESSEKH